MTDIKLIPLLHDETESFATRNQKSFIYAVEEEFGELEQEPISKEDILTCLSHPMEEAYNISLNGEIVGGVAVRIYKATGINSLDLIFVDTDCFNRGIGFKAWKLIEEKYPDTKEWETHTPTFLTKNIHFYVNKLGFHIVEYFNPYHPEPEDSDIGGADFFLFRKKM